MTETIVETRHPALVELLKERGLVGEGVRVLEHALPEDVDGKHVIGVLPHHLSCLCETVTEVPLAGLRPDERGKEIGLERLREIAGAAVTYVVRKVETAQVSSLRRDQEAVSKILELERHEARALEEERRGSA